nr:hypothetical protein [uncultured Draconibacterium sp.]
MRELQLSFLNKSCLKSTLSVLDSTRVDTLPTLVDRQTNKVDGNPTTVDNKSTKVNRLPTIDD